MASESSLRRQQDSSKDSSSTQRSAWSTALIRLEKEDPIRGMNELLPNATYTDAGVSIEEKALSALAAITQMPVTNQKATWGTRRNVYEATQEEISNLNPKGAGIGYRYYIFIEDDQPVNSMDEEYVNVLKEMGLDVNAEWITFTVISRGMPCPAGKQPCTLDLFSKWRSHRIARPLLYMECGKTTTSMETTYQLLHPFQISFTSVTLALHKARPPFVISLPILSTRKGLNRFWKIASKRRAWRRTPWSRACPRTPGIMLAISPILGMDCWGQDMEELLSFCWYVLRPVFFHPIFYRTQLSSNSTLLSLLLFAPNQTSQLPR